MMNSRKRFFLLTTCLLLSGFGLLFAQNSSTPQMLSGPPPKEFVPSPDKHPVVDLWPGGAPGATSAVGSETYRLAGSPQSDAKDLLVIASVHRPSLTLFLPPKKIATGTAIIVAAGGAFREIWITDEGYRVGEWLSQRGVAVFVLKYRLPNEPESPYHIEDSLADLQRAIRTVKSRASEWNLNPERVGVMGFSAGGALASLAGNRFADPVTHPVDAVDQLSARPAFQALIYRTPLTPAMPYSKSLETNTPPTFLLCGADDPVADKYPELYRELKSAGVPVELHIYSGVGHGFAIQGNSPRAVASWPDRLWDWLFDLGMLTRQ